jgi:hypothetical protein
MLCAQRNGTELRYIGRIEIEKREILQDEYFNYMQMFFDKWNNLYLPNADSRIITVFRPNFLFSYNYNIGEGERYFDGQAPLMSWMGLIAYASENSATLFYINNGKINDVIHHSSVGGYSAIDDFTLLFDNDIKKPRSWILLDREKRTIKELDPLETIAYLRKNGARYGLSLQGDAILFQGWTWEQYGSALIWNDKIHGSWQAIDKDKIAYDGEEGKTLDGKTVVTYDFVGYPKKTKKAITGNTFDYEGNAFVFCEDDIYYLGRDWGYDRTFEGKVNVSGRCLCLHPGPEELTLSMLEKNEAVTVLEKTIQKESIGGKAASWYKVKRKDGLVGWMFGAYLILLNGEDGILTYDSPAMSLRGLK